MTENASVADCCVGSAHAYVLGFDLSGKYAHVYWSDGCGSLTWSMCEEGRYEVAPLVDGWAPAVIYLDFVMLLCACSYVVNGGASVASEVNVSDDLYLHPLHVVGYASFEYGTSEVEDG